MSSLPFPSEHALVQPTPPELTAADAAGIARELFGVEAAARSLGSHQDRNFLLEGADGPLLLKIANPATTAEELEAQSLAADRVAELAPAVRVPRSRRSERRHRHRHRAIVRLRWPDAQRPTPRLPRRRPALGRRLPLPDGRARDRTPRRRRRRRARRARSAGHRATPPVGPPPCARRARRLAPYVGDPDLRRRLRSAADAAWSVVERHAAALRVQVIHGDLTDDNVVWSDPVTRVPDGVIDFGDLNRSWTVGEVAITISSLLHHDGVDLRAALRCLAAYQEVRPLSRAEAESLWPLVVLRGAILVASAHHVVATDPRQRVRRREPPRTSSRPSTQPPRCPCPLRPPSCSRRSARRSTSSACRRTCP